MQRAYQFLFVIVSTLQLVSSGDDAVVINVQGIVGGSLLLRCELERSHRIIGLYFLKTLSDGKDVFINGFYTKPLPVLPEYIHRTIINRSDLSMEMLNLSPADEGNYACIPFCNSGRCNQTNFHLTLTANYNVPVITVQGCGNDPAIHNCVIGCSSSGGYPHSHATWSVLGDETSSLLRDEGAQVFMQDPHSRLWNVSHTVALNCTWPLKITCSVGGVVSRAVTILWCAKCRVFWEEVYTCTGLQRNGKEIFIGEFHNTTLSVPSEYINPTIVSNTERRTECGAALWREFLFVIVATLPLVSSGVDAVVINVQGIVGGSLHLRCGLKRSRNITGLYFQKEDSDGQVIFINGFYNRPVTVLPEYKNRTFVNKTDLSMKMTNLTLSDEGDYTCFSICNSVPCNQTNFHLTVTANYSIPVITVQGCGNDAAIHNCVIGCSSSGGSRRSSATWSVLGDETSSLLGDEGAQVFMQDPHSRLWNVSHTVTLNCTWPLKITCSVGGVESRAVSVCTSFLYFCLNTEK